ncbi:MAG: hypothetical protein JW786_04315 [Desulfobacterales bacterium]|nr:hypothetical protein [Desulfobacterales bacterium]
MKKLFIFLLALSTLSGMGMYNKVASHEIKAQDCMFLNSLHYTANGMGYWYSKENGGIEKITGIPYSELGCKNCHVKACDTCHKEVKEGKAAYSKKAAGNQGICLNCHGREQAIMKIDHQMNQEDVHVSNNMTCIDCHSEREMHGDGVEYVSMRQEGAMDAQCENCHDDIRPTDSHLVHQDKLDCKACHVRHVVSCTNCHFDTLVKKGKRVAIPVSGWVFLINHRGKVTSGGMQNFVTKGNKTFLIFAPHMSHSVMKDGRKCEECHGTKTAKQVHEGKVNLTWLKDGKVENLKGVIPVAEGVNYQCVYQDRKEDKWVPIEHPDEPMLHYPAFGEPLSKKQLESLVKVQEAPIPKME